MGQNFLNGYFSYVSAPSGSPIATVYLRGGGTESYTNLDSSGNYAMQPDSKAILHLNFATNIVNGEPNVTITSCLRTLPDGSQETFSLAYPGDNNIYLLTGISDPQANSVTLTYDSYYRLTDIEDAIGQHTSVYYASTNTSDATWFYRISQVKDPFGRSCYFGYDTNDSPYMLTQITDVIGITSQFAFAANNNGCMSGLTTPYGTTTFDTTQYAPTTSQLSMLVTDPEGHQELTYFQGGDAGIPSYEIPPTNGIILDNDTNLLQYRNTFYWDKNAMQQSAGDLTKAKIFQWLHLSIGEPAGYTGHTLENIKYPLESRIWYNYPGQTAGIMEDGITNSSPASVARVLDDGSTQLYQISVYQFVWKNDAIHRSCWTHQYLYLCRQRHRPGSGTTSDPHQQRRIAYDVL